MIFIVKQCGNIMNYLLTASVSVERYEVLGAMNVLAHAHVCEGQRPSAQTLYSWKAKGKRSTTLYY